MANEIGQALSRASGNALDIDTILQEIAHILDKRLDYDQGIILLADPKQEKLVFRAGFGFDQQLAKQIQSTEFSLDNPDSRGMFVISYWAKKPFLVNDINEVSEDISPKSLAFAKSMGVRSFICCPIIYENQSLGVLAVHNTTNHNPLIQRDINLLMGITPQIGITINNIKLMEATLRQFQSTLQVLAASTDARDPITAGHSLKVTEYAIGICGEMELSKSYTEMIRVAALLHDYGKIGVSDSSLKKPGKLTEIEYAEIKTHAQKTRDILEQIHFDGIYAQVPEIAGSHHEKLDGSGYPLGLKGDQIPLGAKILAVADVYEAVTAKRHYRNPMAHEEAAKVLIDGIGNHFDHDCVMALLNLLNKQTKAADSSDA
jgi:HD-GYP domain-containing protein (c-di-GMP phosphodiesterase class II)